jgi:hypothetical protein
MRTRLFATILCVFAGLSVAIPAEAQYGARRARSSSNRATGETYHVEVAGTIWNPTPNIVISSEGLGQLGDNIDFVNTLGIEQQKFKQFKSSCGPGRSTSSASTYADQEIRPARSIASRSSSTDSAYVGIPVQTSWSGRRTRFGDEWISFLYKTAGSPAVSRPNYTDVKATLTATVGARSSRTRAPIPAIGFIGRGYIVPNISDGEFSAFSRRRKRCNSDDYSGEYYDFDLYGTVNFTDHSAPQVGLPCSTLHKVKRHRHAEFQVHTSAWSGAFSRTRDHSIAKHAEKARLPVPASDGRRRTRSDRMRSRAGLSSRAAADTPLLSGFKRDLPPSLNSRVTVLSTGACRAGTATRRSPPIRMTHALACLPPRNLTARKRPIVEEERDDGVCSDGAPRDAVEDEGGAIGRSSIVEPGRARSRRCDVRRAPPGSGQIDGHAAERASGCTTIAN